MTEKRKKIPAVILLILFALYWAAVNFLVSAVLVPSFMEKLDAFQRISEQSYAEQVQETEMKQNLTAMTVVGKPGDGRTVLRKWRFCQKTDTDSRAYSCRP